MDGSREREEEDCSQIQIIKVSSGLYELQNMRMGKVVLLTHFHLQIAWQRITLLN